jgi:hypothetical protein
MSLTAPLREELIRRYEEGPAKLRAAFSRVPEEARQWRPAPGKWSAHEVVCHAADAETNAASRIRYLLGEEKPVIMGYDQARWARELDYHAAPCESALAVVEAVRAHTAQLLRRLPESGWSAAGTHSESGAYTTENWLSIYAEHLENHSRQIDRNLEAWRAAGKT